METCIVREGRIANPNPGVAKMKSCRGVTRGFCFRCMILG